MIVIIFYRALYPTCDIDICWKTTLPNLVSKCGQQNKATSPIALETPWITLPLEIRQNVLLKVLRINIYCNQSLKTFR